MKLDWRRGMLYIIIMGMEACWLYALLVPLNNQVAGGQLSVPGLLLLYPAAFIFNKLWPGRWPRLYLYIANGLAWATGMLLIVKTQLYGGLGLFEPAWLLALPQALGRIIQTVEPEILLLGGSIVLWWLGGRLARLRVSFAASVTEFQFGLVILLIVFFATTQLGLQLDHSIPVALVFFLLALLGMSLSHAGDGAGWLTGSNRGLWSGLLLAGIGLILILGLLVGLVMTPDFLRLVLVPFQWVVGMLWQGMLWLVSLFPEPELAALPAELAIPEGSAPEPDIFQGWTMSEPLQSWLRSGYGIFLSGLMLVFLWRISSQMLGWFRRKVAATSGAEVELLPGAFRADLLGLLKRLMLKLMGLRLPFRRGKKLASVSPEAASVRQIYRQLLGWAASRGYSRHLSQTPQEYLHTLEGLLPAAQEDLRFITAQYVSARYSPRSPTEKELYQTRQSWHRLRRNRLQRPDSEQTK